MNIINLCCSLLAFLALAWGQAVLASAPSVDWALEQMPRLAWLDPQRPQQYAHLSNDLEGLAASVATPDKWVTAMTMSRPMIA